MIYRASVEKELKKAFKLDISKYYFQEEKGDAVTLAWDQLQTSLHCCGVDDYKDYQKNEKWAKGDNVVPESCCVLGEDSKLLEPTCTSAPSEANSYYLKGCFQAVNDWALDHLNLLIFIALAFGLVEVLGVFLAFCLVQSINRVQMVKASVLAQISYVLMAIGAAMFLLSFLGYCGALRESQCMLTTYGILLIVILVLEIAACYLAVFYRASVEKQLKEAFRLVISKYYLGITLSRSPVACWVRISELLMASTCISAHSEANSYYLKGCFQAVNDWTLDHSNLLIFRVLAFGRCYPGRPAFRSECDYFARPEAPDSPPSSRGDPCPPPFVSVTEASPDCQVNCEGNEPVSF
ncbi:unnamed protein product [Phaedon cochleariae]|uniref:Tetraspanin n=1 Tax=Phaedon cochleariae TaxID=80249 RepID=A0A9N9SK09_PHACE|nr:unnamed protein product [Phaedon cochleariae]